MPLGDMFGQSFATVNGQKPRNSDRIQPSQPLNLRGAFEAATNIPVVGDALSGGMALYDAANGDYGSAAMNALGVLPFVSGTFIGKGAKTWDAIKAADAEKRIAAGDDARKVWKETGTFKGPDGHLRQEIDDSAAAFTKSSVKELRDNNGRRNGVIFPHEQLHSAYPESANVWTTKSAGADTGAYHDGAMGQSDMIGLGLPKRGIPDMEELRGTNLHELQHAIQNKEGWAKGGSADTSSSSGLTKDNTMEWAQRAYERSHESSGDPLLDALFSGHKPWDQLTDRERLGWIDPARSEAYRSLAGEAEARATQARMNMNMDQRLNIYPLDSYDVPVDQLIVRGNTPIGAAFGGK